ncbi:MAG: hypothetical protein U0792_23315 [Gemmataceae bacterium]
MKGELTELSLAGWKLLLHTERVAELESRLLDTLAARFTPNIRLMTTHDRQKTLARMEYVGDESLLQAVVDHLLAAKKLVGDLRRVARADFAGSRSNQRKLKDSVIVEPTSRGCSRRRSRRSSRTRCRERRGPQGHLRGGRGRGVSREDHG